MAYGSIKSWSRYNEMLAASLSCEDAATRSALRVVNDSRMALMIPEMP